jgi:pantoate--beta-alanine ligase
MPELITSIAGLRDRLAGPRQHLKRIGLVPTMGALHAGHASLIEAAMRDCDLVVVSIFVNPIQFNNPDDYAKYARNLQTDLDLCGTYSVHVVFAPTVDEMYPTAQETIVDVPEVSKGLCGEFRPGHFRGVATVVTKLFNIVQPGIAYFGEKDAQQLAVIRTMVRDLNMPLSIRGLPTVREPDGLAMSSRNERLSPVERPLARVLYKALQAAKASLEDGVRDVNAIRQTGLTVLAGQPEVRLEYLEVVDAITMRALAEISGSVCVAIAAWVGSVRLIDNVFWPQKP